MLNFLKDRLFGKQKGFKVKTKPTMTISAVVTRANGDVEDLGIIYGGKEVKRSGKPRISGRRRGRNR